MIFKDMVDEVKANLGLEDIVPLDESVYVKQLINRGVVDLLARTRCVVRCIHLRVSAGVPEYTLDHVLLALVDIEDGRTRVNRSSNQRSSFTLIRSDILRLNPAPGEDGEVDVWAVKRPGTMVGDNDSPGSEQFGAIPEEFQDAIILYALWHASDYADDATGQQGERFRMLYEGQDGRGGRLGQIRAQVNKRGTARAPNRRVRGLRAVSGYSNWAG